MKSSGRPWFLLLLALLCSVHAACGTYEDKRVRELLHEKGFGTRAQGDATVENYVAGGDMVRFLLPPTAYQEPASQELFRLTLPQRVGIDGTILVPYVGKVQVLGLTESELATLVKGLLRPVFQFQIDMQAQIVLDGKMLYAFGEVRRKGLIPLAALGGDATILRAVASIGWTGLGNLSRVTLIRPDAEHPLTVEVNFYEMITTGYTARNVRIRENDIIYIPPTFLGLIARILERALSPVRVAVQAMLGIAQIRSSYDVATGRTTGVFFRF
ncbi:MAG: polysaccharide biosynthesis/export family protein [Planctomycetota bacterium]